MINLSSYVHATDSMQLDIHEMIYDCLGRRSDSTSFINRSTLSSWKGRAANWTPTGSPTVSLLIWNEKVRVKNGWTKGKHKINWKTDYVLIIYAFQNKNVRRKNGWTKQSRGKHMINWMTDYVLMFYAFQDKNDFPINPALNKYHKLRQIFLWLETRSSRCMWVCHTIHTN